MPAKEPTVLTNPIIARPQHLRPTPLARRAMTFIELLLALAITTSVCGIMAVLMASTASGTKSQNDGRRNLVRLQSVKACLQDELLNARAILAAGPNYLVYWIGDQPNAITPTNGAVNLSELRLLEVDTATGNLNLYTTKFPNGWSNANVISADTTYIPTTSWYSAACSAKGTYFNPTLIATGATAMTVSLDSATPVQARFVHLTITLVDNSVSRQVVLANALESPVAPW